MRTNDNMQMKDTRDLKQNKCCHRLSKLSSKNKKNDV